MGIEFVFNEEKEFSRCGQIVYCKKDLALRYRVLNLSADSRSSTLAESIDRSLGISNQSFFYLILDTLTLTFDKQSKKLLSFDAYTNIHIWRQVERGSFPPLDNTISRGSLLLKTLPKNDDRLSADITPIYEFSLQDNMLRVMLDETAVPSKYYEVLQNVFVGMYGTSLVELLLRQIQII